MSSRMHDISYSSINAPHGRGGGGMMMGGGRKSPRQSCFRSCFLSLPYATITSTFLVISGLIITSFSAQHLGGIVDRLGKDLFYQRFKWVEEMRVVLMFVGGFVAVVMMANLIIGFATSSVRLDPKGVERKQCECWRHSATNCLIRFVFLLNTLLHVIVLLLLILFCVTSFSLYLVGTLCTESTAPSPDLQRSHDANFGDSSHVQQINLQPFAHLLSFTTSDSQQLQFRENRLKGLCRDYVPTLRLYTLITLLGLALLYLGFHCYLINLTVNRIRISTYKKYTELLYLNATEMQVFGDTSFDVQERF